MQLKYYTGQKVATSGEINEFLKKSDNEFHPRLSSRVNIKDYSEKLCENAVLIIAKLNNQDIVGINAFYANDINSMKAYLSNINVLQEYQGIGIASNLIKKMITYLNHKGFKEISLEVYKDNLNAISLYKYFGFDILIEKKGFITMKRILN
jgi:ribosomal protein S18 acetylase RimI-like enzyme